MQVHPQGDEKNVPRLFCCNEAKMGLNLVTCIPADEIEVVGGAVYDAYEHGRESYD